MTVHELLIADHEQLRQQIADIQKTLATKPAQLEALFLAFKATCAPTFKKKTASTTSMSIRQSDADAN